MQFTKKNSGCNFLYFCKHAKLRYKSYILYKLFISWEWGGGMCPLWFFDRTPISQVIKAEKMLNRRNKSCCPRFLYIYSEYLPEQRIKSPDGLGVNVRGRGSKGANCMLAEKVLLSRSRTKKVSLRNVLFSLSEQK